MVSQAVGSLVRIGCLYFMAGIIGLNQRRKSSLIALTSGCPLRPYAMHRAEHLHLQFLKPAAFAAAISICCYSL